VSVVVTDAVDGDPVLLVHLDPHDEVGVEVDGGPDVQVVIEVDLAVQIEFETVGEPSVVLTKLSESGGNRDKDTLLMQVFPLLLFSPILPSLLWSSLLP
jgi:hypothetical protein